MQAKHTPGPWQVEPLANVVTNKDRQLVAEPWHCGGNSEEANANAKLISMAPDMLDLLQILSVDLKALAQAGLLKDYIGIKERRKELENLLQSLNA